MKALLWVSLIIAFVIAIEELLTCPHKGYHFLS